MAIKGVIVKLQVTPNPNSKVVNDKIDVIIDIFWKELGHFQNKTGFYGLHQGRFLLPDALNGNNFTLCLTPVSLASLLAVSHPKDLEYDQWNGLG